MGNDYNRRGTRFARLLYLVILCMLLSPAAALAQEKGINLELKNVTVQEAVATLNRTENYSIIISSDEVDLGKRISVSAKNATIREVLDQVFAGQNVTCTIDGRRISVTKKQPAAPAKTAAAANTLHGRVTDVKGQPIIAATVAVEGTSKGTLTGIDGDFELKDVKLPAKINVSYLGYISQTIEIKAGGGNAPLEIVLKESDNLMDEVVVVGYGTQRRANLSGAVATISGKDLNARPVVSAANALQGADPSVNITFGTGSPESAYSINIRGSVSLNTGSPLVLADGVEVSLSQINPNDIESVSVLKDASSCAIYGAKASAGVVLITTKAGKKGERARVSYNGRFGWAKNTTSTDFITTGYDHVRIVNQFMNDSSDGTMNIFRYTEENGGLQKLYDRRNDRTEHPDRPWVEVGDDGKYYYYGNFDWYGYFYNRVRTQQEHNLSLSGGTDKVTYYASGRIYQQYGMFNINKDKYTDYAFRTKVSAQMTPWLKYSNNISFDTSGYKYGGHSDYEGTINALQSNICAAFVPFNPDGTIVQYVNQLGKNSPIGAGRGGQMSADRSKNSKENRYLTLSNQFDITILKKLVVTAAYDYRQRDRLYKYRNNTFEYSRQQGVMETFTSGSVENSYREVHYGYKGHNVNIYGTYENTWGGHHFKATAGGQYEDYRSKVYVSPHPL
ncbi:SusC/RagA family TonB-linked outer membrane protein, partial [uncultured Alistipes sp.]|uniref:SusC/RagA family TonB-linked outer membrane protein n=1 Tax=uncultured Alistipes sp. TaxID=538949 RepID=UPI002587A746